MKKINVKLYTLVFFGLLVCLGACKKEQFSNEPEIVNSFSVKGKDNSFFRATINADHTITIKVSPYLSAEEMLASAVPTFYLSKGATVFPDPTVPQNFASKEGVKYTVTAEDGVTKRDYIVKWGVSDQLADGQGFSYAEIGVTKNFAELGYPGEFNNFGLADSKEYGDLNMYHGYCGNYIVLLSRAYIDANPSSIHGIKVVNKLTLQPAGSLNLGAISAADLKIISSDYKGKLVGLVVKNGETEVYYWATPTDAPKSIGKINVNLASTTDGSSNFQVSGDIAGDAWITALAPRGAKGEHYRVKVTNGQLASTSSFIATGHSSSDSNGFQMIAPLDASDQPSFIVGDTEGAAATANSIKAYMKSASGSTLSVMPGLWQNVLQAWWVGTGLSTARAGGRTPVSALTINGKKYVVVTSGTAWWHSAAVLSPDLQTLAHENLNIATSVNRGWSYGAWVDWYYDEEAKEGHLAIWFGRSGLRTYKMTCYE